MGNISMRVKQGLENLVYLYILVFPRVDADTLYVDWKRNKIFADYNRPSRDILRLWFVDFKEELEEKGITLS